MRDISGGSDLHRIGKCEEALALLRAGLAMIDEAGGLPDAGAHVDLAICRIEQALVEARARN